MSSTSATTGRYSPKIEERRRRIITATTDLAVEGGFAAVRSRAICEKASVSMGTLYRDFSSLEEILLIGFAEQFKAFGDRFENGVAPGETPIERVEALFTAVTEAMTSEENYGKAIVAAIAAGQTKAMGALMNLTLVINQLGQAAWTGIPTTVNSGITERDVRIAFTLERVWFSVLIGWAAGMQSPEAVIGEVVATAELFLAPVG